MSGAVVVTGGLGLVGSQTVYRLVADGRDVVVADLDTPANRKKARVLPRSAEIRWTDLTNPAEVDRLVSEVAPDAIIHLAAVIPPPIYRNPAVARKVNVDATATLVRAAEAQPNPPRFVQASSNAVYGSRNPHRNDGPVTADTPTRAVDVYSGTKLEAEELVRASRLPWVVLRLGGVLSTDPKAMPFSGDALFFESALPTDGRLHSVDVRDVATAFANATTADVVGEILLIAGDDSHKIRQGQIGAMLAAARGLTGVLPQGRPGNPDSDDDWFVTDWMDPARAQEALSFQRHSLPDMMSEMRAKAGWTRHLMRPLVPFARLYVKRQGAYYKSPGQYADPWGAIRARLGEPAFEKT
ncbi:MAG TPA: NAD(P)-dependent oxidoreductase [Mycobacterium sp.]|nr:NAD(P)-dependent oxidoreductase [Mycobacterium sp.]